MADADTDFVVLGREQLARLILMAEHLFQITQHQRAILAALFPSSPAVLRKLLSPDDCQAVQAAAQAAGEHWENLNALFAVRH